MQNLLTQRTDLDGAVLTEARYDPDGRLLFDGNLSALVSRFVAHKTVSVQLDQSGLDLSGYGEVLSSEDGRYTLRVPKDGTARLTARLLADMPVIDLLVEEPPMAMRQVPSKRRKSPFSILKRSSPAVEPGSPATPDRKSTRLNSSHRT